MRYRRGRRSSGFKRRGRRRRRGTTISRYGSSRGGIRL